ENTLSEKAGVHFDSVKTGPFAAGLTLFFDNSPEEARKMQVSTDEMYEVFLQHVASGRKMTRDAVHEIAQGRVWSGEDALKNGLVDRLGTMDDAIQTAARMANLKNYRVADYPSIPDPIQRLVEELTSQKDEELRQARLVKSEFPAFYPLFSEWQAIRKSNGIQAKIPVQVPFK
ncbi:MAG: S49 family peptidase, partial [Haliscomenobacter sp.]